MVHRHLKLSATATIIILRFEFPQIISFKIASLTSSCCAESSSNCINCFETAKEDLNKHLMGYYITAVQRSFLKVHGLNYWRTTFVVYKMYGQVFWSRKYQSFILNAFHRVRPLRNRSLLQLNVQWYLTVKYPQVLRLMLPAPSGVALKLTWRGLRPWIKASK